MRPSTDPRRSQNRAPIRRGAISLALAVGTLCAVMAAAGIGFAAPASADQPTIQLPGSPDPTPPSGTDTSAEAALASAQAHLQVVSSEIDQVTAQIKGLQAKVGKISRHLTAAVDGVASTETRLAWARTLLSNGEVGISGGFIRLLGVISGLRSEAAAAERRLMAVRAVASSDPSLAALFAADTSLAALQADQARTQATIDGLLVQTRVTDPGAAGAPGATSIAYGDWAGLLVRTMGIAGCQSDKVVLVAWQVAEGTDAAWNPLATTRDAPGATQFNGAGVKSYPSLDAGLQATAATLWGGYYSYGYGWIVYDLATCASPEVTAQAINASAWCAGCAGGTYVTGVLSRVEADYQAYADL